MLRTLRDGSVFQSDSLENNQENISHLILLLHSLQLSLREYIPF